MIQDKETQEKFGYLATSLTSGSNKLIIIKCDYCGKLYERNRKQIKIEHKKINKDACGGDCKNAKRKELCLAQYGVDNVARIPEAREKIKQSALDPKLTKIKKEKSKQTCLEKYGVEHYGHTKMHRQRMLGNNYSDGPPPVTEETKEKIRQTNQERYGADCFLGSEAGKQAKLDWCQKTYGVDNPFQAEEIKEKIKETSLEKYGETHYLKVPENAAKHGQDVLNSKIKQGKIKLYQNKTYKQWTQEKGCSKTWLYASAKEHGIETAITLDPKESKLETLFSSEVLDKIGCEYIKQYQVENKSADFYIPSSNLIVEVNGSYWHSELYHDSKYHTGKRSLYLKHGYSPLFFMDVEVYNKLPIVTSVVKHKLGQSNKVFARKCVLSDVIDCKEFLDSAHLMGNGNGKYFSLLDSESNIMACMQIKRIKNGGHEISRFCNALNTNVVGGFSRLLKYAANTLNIKRLDTFIDLRYGLGDYLESMGFVKAGPAYPSFKWIDGTDVYNRTKFHASTGYDKGFVKMWDCGQQRYTKDFS